MTQTGRRCKSRIRSVFVLLLIFLAPLPVVSQDRPHDVTDGIGRLPEAEMAEDGFVASTVGLYKRHISPVDGDRCPMYPSCSQYSLQAFRKHGLFMGWMMTCDRLLRCGRDELTIAPTIDINGRSRCYDPVEDNDFWWSR